MSVMIQIRNVPDEVHRTLKARAALAGMSLSDYLLREVCQVAETLTLEEVLERLHKQPPITLSEQPADAIRAIRDGR